MATIVGNIFRAVGNGIKNLWNNMTGSGLTDQQVQQNEFATSEREAAQGFEERMSNTAFQRQVADMRQAGVNPALLYGNGSNGASTPSSSGMQGSSIGSPATMSDLMQLAFLKPQIENMRAQSENLRASAELNRKKADTEGVEKQLKEVIRDMYPDLTNAQIVDLLASQDVKESQMGLNDATAALTWSKKEFQDKENASYQELLDLRKEIMKAEKQEKLSSAEEAKARAWLERVEAKYEEDTGMKMSSNEYLALALAIGNIFGVKPDRITSFLKHLR